MHIRDLVHVPGYPVYYDPHVSSNYFFYDGLYWVFQNDNWYQSGWYNGPWFAVAPRYVPAYVLRVPVRYYRHPPQYFHGWRADEAPRWAEHWGNDWEQQRSGWDQWNRHSVPSPAPLPVYQKSYVKDHYPVAPSNSNRFDPRNTATNRAIQIPDSFGTSRPTRKTRPTSRITGKAMDTGTPARIKIKIEATARRRSMEIILTNTTTGRANTRSRGS